MSSNKCCCHEIFDEKDAKIDRITSSHKNTEGALIPMLHEVQELYGFLPDTAFVKISNSCNIPLSEIYGVATFYSFFSLKPKGKYEISICMGTACYVKGAGKILDRFREELGLNVGECDEDGKFSLSACRCLGACGLAPVIKVNEHVHGKLALDDIPEILSLYK